MATIKDANKKPSAGIQSLETGLAIAFALVRAGRRLTLSEISSQLKLMPSTAHRHLVSLSRLGLVQQAEPNGPYELGPSAAEFGFAALRSLDAQKLWAEAVSRLRDETGLTTLGVVWGTFGPTILQWKASMSPVTMHVHLGAVLPLTTSASGLVFSAFFDADRVEPLVDQELKKEKRATYRGKLLTRELYDSVISAVRKDSLVIIQGDLHRGIDSISAPVFDSSGTLQLALTLLAAEGDLDVDPAGRHITCLRTVAAELSSQLGYAADAPKPAVK
ncbi:MAG: IclR family transcriptional regulator [Pseudomonadota bacterium]